MSNPLGFGEFVKEAPAIRPLLNIGCLMDIQAGRWVQGAHGESIINGGLARITGVGGRANTYKSTIGHYMLLRILDRYASSTGMALDTEMSMSRERFVDLSASMEQLSNEDFTHNGRFLLTDGTVAYGDVWFEKIKEYIDAKIKMKKSISYKTTPMVDREGNKYKAMIATPVEIDSLSRMTTTNVENMLHKNQAGDSGNNMEAVNGNKAKHQMLVQLPIMTEQGSCPFIITAHVDDNIVLDPYAAPSAKLSFLSNKLKFKYVPNQFMFLTNNLWYCYGAKPLNNRTTKMAEFPYRPGDDNLPSDLMEVQIQNLRGKYGCSGVPYVFLCSQKEGLLDYLTEFYHCKQNGRFGLGGDDKRYYVELCPEHKLQRTTVRQKLREIPELRRAMNFTAEIFECYRLTPTLPDEAKVDMATLYKDIQDMGYDWNVLLKTRGWWTYEEDNNPLPFLSSMDLIRMRMGLYVPYWYEKVTGVKIDPTKKSAA